MIRNKNLLQKGKHFDDYVCAWLSKRKLTASMAVDTQPYLQYS